MDTFTQKLRQKLFAAVIRFTTHRSPRKLPLILSMFGITVVIWGAYLSADYINNPNQSLYKNVFATVVLSLGGSLTASAIVAFLVLTYGDAGRRRKMLKKFLEVRDLATEVAIVLPRFPCPTTNFRDDPNVQRSPNGAIKDFRLMSKYRLAFDDIAAARHISAIFIELGLAPPRIEFDDDVFALLFNPTTETQKEYHEYYKTFILIGLFSNEITVELSKRSDASTERYFKLSSTDEILKSQQVEISICSYDTTLSDWQETNSGGRFMVVESNLLADPNKRDEKPDFALIAKCRAPNRHTCLVVGGGRARGTRKAGSYFRQNWEMLYEHVAERPGSKTESKAFASSYSLSGKRRARLQPQTHRVAD